MFKAVLLSVMFLSSVVPGYPQLLSLGIKAGIPLTDALTGYSDNRGTVSTNTERWLVGPTVELHLPFRLSVEVDALYRRESYQASSTSASPAIAPQWFNAVPTTTTISHSLNDLQFPFLAKYELHSGLIRPYLDGGVAYRYLFGGGPIDNANSAGITLGGGLTLKLLLLRLSPEIRYTHWGNSNVNAPYLTSSSNQADFLVGFSF